MLIVPRAEWTETGQKKKMKREGGGEGRQRERSLHPNRILIISISSRNRPGRDGTKFVLWMDGGYFGNQNGWHLKTKTFWRFCKANFCNAVVNMTETYTPARSSKPNPVDSASIVSKTLFTWFTPLIQLGANRPLEVDDIYEVPLSHGSMTSLTLFMSKYWTSCDTLGFDLALCFRAPLIASNLVFMLFVAVAMVQPFFVSKILEYVSTGEATIFGIQSGVGIVLLLGGVSAIGIVAFSTGFYYSQEFALYVRNTCIALIFQKSLNICNTARSRHTTGEIVTLMSVDAERIFHGVLLASWYWMGPAGIVGALILLIFQVGYAATMVCSGVLLLWFWFQLNVGTWLGNIRDNMVLFTDERVKLTNEVLQGIRVVKLYAWERPSEERIHSLRALEMRQLQRYLALKMINLATQFVGPLLVSAVLFVTYYLLGGKLTVAKVYTVLSILNIIRLPISLIPLVLSSGEEAMRSLARIKSYLSNEEGVPVARSLPAGVGDGSKEGCLVAFKDASFSWEDASASDRNKGGRVNSDEVVESGVRMDVDEGTTQTAAKLVLRQVNLTIRRGEFVAVVGSVGAGKTSLLASMLGQLNLLSGHQMLNADVAYVGQEHWIQNLTVQDNVLFGSPLDAQRYEKILDACELSQDLLSLPNADHTEIGERGITLSGGQKARVNIARALYAANKDLYLLDDPLAAVDVHVGKKIFENAFLKLLQGKARVLVLSSNYHLLPHCDKILVVNGGDVDMCSSYNELKTRYPIYTSRDGEDKLQQDKRDADITFAASDDEEAGEESSSDSEDKGDKSTGDSITGLIGVAAAAPARRSKLKKSHSMYHSHRSMITEKQKSGKVLTTEEDRLKGGVALSSYWQYFASSVDPDHIWDGYVTVTVVIVLFTIGQTTRVFSDMWVGIWASSNDRAESDHSNRFYLTWYVILVGVSALFVFGRAQYFVQSCLRASRNLHNTLLSGLLAAPVNTYFDVTPVGRILNRFSKDLDMMDSLLPDFFLQNVQNTFHIVSVVIVCIISSPFFIIIAVVLGAIFGYIQNKFSKSSREIKRLEGITRSPMYSLFSEMLQGLTTIRAYNKKAEFMQSHAAVADRNQKCLYSFWLAGRWLALRLDFVANAVVTSVSLIAVIIVSEGGAVNAATLGLALVYSLQMATFLQWTVRCAIETENNMTAVERLLAFSKVPSEASRELPGDPSPQSWPTEGAIVMENLSLRYRSDLGLVLNDVSLNIPGRCKVGVCGRTGAGKSSLMLALFRMVEPEEGSVLTIDGVNILSMGLERLRSQLTIIPQDPVMFSGSLRYNLDPFDRYSDQEVWKALDRAHLKDDVITKFPLKLNHLVTERGENLSVGQRQLLCIARALLRKSKIIILDEATASVDTATDKKIQATVRTAFQDCTVLTIAHRLETIADYDRIVVMDAGRVAEYGVPFDLLRKNEEGIFSSLVNSLGPEVRTAFIDTMRRRAVSLDQVERGDSGTNPSDFGIIVSTES